MPAVLLVGAASGGFLAATGPPIYRWLLVGAAAAWLLVRVGASVGLTLCKSATSRFDYFVRGYLAGGLGMALVLSGLQAKAWRVSAARGRAGFDRGSKGLTP
jgi:hypothetical protein